MKILHDSTEESRVHVIFFLVCCLGEILVSWPGFEPEPSAVRALSPNHWTGIPQNDFLT